VTVTVGVGDAFRPMTRAVAGVGFAGAAVAVASPSGPLSGATSPRPVLAGSAFSWTLDFREAFEGPLAQAEFATAVVLARPSVASGVPFLDGGAEPVAGLGVAPGGIVAGPANGRRPNSARASGRTVSEAGSPRALAAGASLARRGSRLQRLTELVAHFGRPVVSGGSTRCRRTAAVGTAGVNVFYLGHARTAPTGLPLASGIPRFHGGAKLVPHLGCPV
jgi:hypothetical protein